MSNDRQDVYRCKLTWYAASIDALSPMRSPVMLLPMEKSNSGLFKKLPARSSRPTHETSSVDPSGAHRRRDACNDGARPEGTKPSPDAAHTAPA
jgi:hypothetical protein